MVLWLSSVCHQSGVVGKWDTALWQICTDFQLYFGLTEVSTTAEKFELRLDFIINDLEC
jgi:hypothetical protein